MRLARLLSSSTELIELEARLLIVWPAISCLAPAVIQGVAACLPAIDTEMFERPDMTGMPPCTGPPF
jgi:hypothetical protein